MSHEVLKCDACQARTLAGRHGAAGMAVATTMSRCILRLNPETFTLCPKCSKAYIAVPEAKLAELLQRSLRDGLDAVCTAGLNLLDQDGKA